MIYNWYTMVFQLEVETNTPMRVPHFRQIIWIPLVMQICCGDSQRWMPEKPYLKKAELL